MANCQACIQLPEGMPLVMLTHVCLDSWLTAQIVAETHGELSAHKTPTIHKVFPLLEKVQSRWEAFCNTPEYAPVKHALDAGLENMRKWYRKTDDTSIYFVSHGNVFIVLVIGHMYNSPISAWPDSKVDISKCRLGRGMGGKRDGTYAQNCSFHLRFQFKDSNSIYSSS